MSAECTTLGGFTASAACEAPKRADIKTERRRGRNTLGDISDTELVVRLLAGDEATFSQLVDRYHNSLVRLAQTFAGSRSVAEEVAQETWVAVIKGLPRFEGRSSLKNWIFRILANRAKTRGVREGRTVPFTALGGDEETFAELQVAQRFDSAGRWTTAPEPWQQSPEHRLLSGEMNEIIHRAIETLPDKQRAVITMRDVQGFTSRDVREILEVSETYQRVLLHRARTKVRMAIAPHLD